MMHSWRKASKVHWESETLAQCTDGFIGVDKINAGSLMRIADAAEKMAQRHTELIAERDRYEERYRTQERECARLTRSNAALRGVITKLKKKS